MDQQLSEKERKIIGFSLFSTSMRIGPESFSVIEEIINKIGVKEEFEFWGKNWISYAKKSKSKRPKKFSDK